MATAFAPTSQATALSADGEQQQQQQQPHHSPPPLLDDDDDHNSDPFAHQLHPTTASPPHSQQQQQQQQQRGRPSRQYPSGIANGVMPGTHSSGQPMPVPPGGGRISGLRELGFAGGSGGGGGGGGGPRSPPSNKSTSHVPCKFYRQGACQAGKACPFLHSDEPVTERAPCKYFTKGNCKFGHKCALAHILPNGHVVNAHMGGRGHHNQQQQQQQQHQHQHQHAAFSRIHAHDPPPTSSLLTMQAHQTPAPPAYPYDDPYAHQNPHYDLIPSIDTAFSAYGSPPADSTRANDAHHQKNLTVMDVPLPASFDSQGISHMARYGPIASSVPAKFLAASPPASYHADSPALRTLHDSAFGDAARGRAALGSSPPDSTEPPAHKMLHSELLAANRSRGLMSSSVGARPVFKDDEWDDTDMIGKFEEDLLPHSLSDLLTPQEKMRRFSRDNNADASLSRFGASPTASDTRYGSPSLATGSPSRFQSLWGKPKPHPESFDSAPGSAPGLPSAFGHVGSPLRTSTLHASASPSLRPRPASGDPSPFLSSPPRHPSMSMISQQLQRTRLSPSSSLSNNLNHSHPARLGPLDRAVSSSSVSLSRERIDEEQGLFSMEDEDDGRRADGDGSGSGSLSASGSASASGNGNGNGNGNGTVGSAKRLSGGAWGLGRTGPAVGSAAQQRSGGAGASALNRGPWGS